MIVETKIREGASAAVESASGERAAFKDATEAVAALAKFAKGFVYPRVRADPEKIACDSAEAAWLKPFARKSPRCVELYGRWASENLPRMVKSLKYVINQEQYDILARRMASDLIRSWREGSGDRESRLTIGAGFCAVDLLFMAINESEDCRIDLVQPFLHVPLEGGALKPLRHILDALLDRDFSVEIPAAIPAGYIATEEHYYLVQGAVFELARRACAPPIAYAYFCA